MTYSLFESLSADGPSPESLSGMPGEIPVLDSAQSASKLFCTVVNAFVNKTLLSVYILDYYSKCCVMEFASR